ncbi:putative 2-oxoglutarate-dependent dioxygenase AOP1 [Tasmannia lanceolata]|uniref:putative 2-oxoglutarate-dependent dioxygenase AOP1 n=1 Tax=Tasmannia lanceolata TaxID=3420 RepID=UPI004063667F
MPSETIPKLPTIDFSGEELEAGTKSWERLRGQVLSATQQFGCFEVVFPMVSTVDRKKLFSLVKDLFALRLEATVKSESTPDQPFPQYMGKGKYPTAPLIQNVRIKDADVRESFEKFTNIMWPEGNPSFSEEIYSFVQKLIGLERMLRGIILESLGVEKYLDSQTESLRTVFHIMHYDPASGSDPAVGLGTHTDLNFFTILCQNDVDGLEVFTEEGEWALIKPSPNSFMVFTGDSFVAWSNGRVHSPRHRVMMSESKERLSVGLFMVPKDGWIIKCPEELVDEEHPQVFKPFQYLEFKRHYFSDFSKDGLTALKEHAGI